MRHVKSILTDLGLCKIKHDGLAYVLEKPDGTDYDAYFTSLDNAESFVRRTYNVTCNCHPRIKFTEEEAIRPEKREHRFFNWFSSICGDLQQIERMAKKIQKVGFDKKVIGIESKANIIIDCIHHIFEVYDKIKEQK